MIPSKPLISYTDDQLKCYGYDLMRNIELCEANLSIIRNELYRRKNSTILSDISSDEVQGLLSQPDDKEITTHTSENIQPKDYTANTDSDLSNLLTPI